MIIYNEKTAGGFPVLKHFSYEETYCFPKMHPWYIIDYDHLAKIEPKGYSFLQHIAEKNWCSSEMTKELFELVKAINPLGDWDAVMNKITCDRIALAISFDEVIKAKNNN